MMRSLHAFALVGIVLSAVACGNEQPRYAYGYSAPGAPPWRPVNDVAMRGYLGNGAVRCPPRQVAPGVWVHFDCRPHRPMTRARGLVATQRSGLVSGALPDSIDHRSDGSEGPVKDQGAVGACTAFSLSTAMDNAIRRMGRQDVTAPLHVWSKYAVPEIGTAGDDTVDKTITLEQVWPYDPAKACKLLQEPGDSCGAAYSVQSDTAGSDPSLRAEQASADSQGRYRIDAVEQFSTPIRTDELAAVIAGGDDVWAALSVDDGDAWTGRTPNNAVIPDYAGDEDQGHAIVFAGYRTVNGAKQFLVHNSWSTGWGDRGYGWLSEAMVTRYLRSAYKVKVTDASAPPSQPDPSTPPAAPGPAPNANGCPAGQVHDAVVQTCIAPCPSGSAPAAGVCLPSIPGFPMPGLAPSQPNACPQGQAPDMMTGTCTNLCAGGIPAVGGMCLPQLPH